MAGILADYDLSGGKTTSTEVVAPNNWRITVTIDSAGSREETFFHLEVEDEDGNWALLRDEFDRAIQFSLRGNGTTSRNVLVTNAANGRVKVKPTSSAVGNLNIDSINA